jgi:predicted phosphodiesterase
MTRLAVITDLHADVHALRDALSHIDRLACERIVCAGDLVDGGLFPIETIALLRERRIPCIRGNHDRWAVGRGHAGEPTADGEGVLHDASGWDLDADTMQFLADLPLAWNAVIDGVRIAVRHGSPKGDMDGIYPDAATTADAQRWLDEANADVLLVGHTHIAFRIELLGGRCIANPGALLRAPALPTSEAWLLDPASGKLHPAPAPGGGTFGVLELPSREFHVFKASDGSEIEIVRTTLGVHDRRGER